MINNNDNNYNSNTSIVKSNPKNMKDVWIALRKYFNPIPINSVKQQLKIINTDELNDIVLLLILVGPPVICFEIVKSEVPKSTSSTFDFGNAAYIPEDSRFKTLGTLILNVDDVVLLVATVPPTLIPVTLVVGAKVNVLPSTDILVTSL